VCWAVFAFWMANAPTAVRFGVFAHKKGQPFCGLPYVFVSLSVLTLALGASVRTVIAVCRNVVSFPPPLTPPQAFTGLHKSSKGCDVCHI
jgi:hypothetical protein